MLGDRVGKKRKVLKDGKLPLNERYDLRFLPHPLTIKDSLFFCGRSMSLT